MLFGLSFFHSIIQERKKFGSVGWNKRYEFNDSDLDTSIKMLRNFIEDAEEIPWDSMQFMTGHINYGGRVTDDNDRILLISLLKNCYSSQILDPSLIYTQHPQKKRTSIVKKKRQDRPAEFSFFDSKLYKIPKPNSNINEVQSYIESLPNSDMPEIFGMHKNASISYQQNESNNLIKTILNVQIPPVVADRPAKGQDKKNRRRKQRMTAEQYESGGQLNKMAKGNEASSQRQGKGEADESAPAVKQDDGPTAVAAASDDSTVMSIA
jgi:dynein heavy chain